MKKRFTTQKRDMFTVETEGAVYSYFDFAANRYRFFDAELNVLEYAPRPHVPDEEPIGAEDPDFVQEAGEGFYIYSTHEVACDLDGWFGLLGLKSGSGEKLTEEKYRRIGRFYNGLCAVCAENEKWGCVDTKGKLVIPCSFREALCFNQYGVSVGDNGLIDRSGNEIPGVAFNRVDNDGADARYFVFSLLTEEQIQSIDAWRDGAEYHR